MSILNRLIRRKTKDKSIIWGIRTPRSVKIRWSILAAWLRVPTNRLILWVLQDWAKQHADILLDSEARNRLADKINKAYLTNKSV